MFVSEQPFKATLSKQPGQSNFVKATWSEQPCQSNLVRTTLSAPPCQNHLSAPPCQNHLVSTTLSEPPCQNHLVRTTLSEPPLSEPPCQNPPCQNHHLRTTFSEWPGQNNHVRTNVSAWWCQSDSIKQRCKSDLATVASSEPSCTWLADIIRDWGMQLTWMNYCHRTIVGHCVALDLVDESMSLTYYTLLSGDWVLLLLLWATLCWEWVVYM